MPDMPSLSGSGDEAVAASLPFEYIEIGFCSLDENGAATRTSFFVFGSKYDAI